jgi:chaperonin GroEL
VIHRMKKWDLLMGAVQALIAMEYPIFSSCEIQCDSQDEKMGYSIAIKACTAPIRRISENAGVSPDLILREINLNKGLGYNAATDEFVDLIEEGVIDPVKVTRTALKNAASVATTFMSLDAVVFEEEDET